MKKTDEELESINFKMNTSITAKEAQDMYWEEKYTCYHSCCNHSIFDKTWEEEQEKIFKIPSNSIYTKIVA